jgi:probable DNA repair protein
MVPQLLETMGWPGARNLSSAEFQAARRWQQAVDVCGSLGFDDRRIHWKTFLAELKRCLDETLFAPESHDAPILIAGPAESAGLTAEAIWFLGAAEDAWPARGSAHPLLPLDVQRETGMPHATPQLDWDLAHSVTRRLLASAPVVRFSYARQKDGVESRPSRLIQLLAGVPQPLPAEFAPAPVPPPQTYRFEDFSRAPMHAAARPESADTGVRGGSTVLTSQSQCPFKAFATARLGAQGWEPAESGLTAAQRGQLLHAVLHAVWGAPPHGIRTHAELQSLTDVTAFVQSHVDRVMAERVPLPVREQMPPRYLELESQRLARLVTEWLELERTRLPFTVTATEREAITEVAGLTLKLRLDRVDRLNDDSVLVVDYKTGNVSPRSWDLPRPDDVQLPLYAGFALDEDLVAGLVFAKVRPGEHCFAGNVGDAAGTLIPTLGGNSALVKSPFTAEMLMDWKETIEQLARDFLAGRADVDPRDPPTTCERCGLYTLCRVQEQPDGMVYENESTSGESVDE